MKLNRLEYILMNNPARAAFQRFVEAPLLKRMGDSIPGGLALEIGCGQGAGTRIILDRFQATRVDAFDLDPRMALRARRRTGPFQPRTALWVGDATELPVTNSVYDAVFDFGIIHHVPRWRSVIGEIARVLKPGGRLYAEEPQARFLAGPIMRRFFDHPTDDRFDHMEFRRVLEGAGLEVLAEKDLVGRFSWFVAKRPEDHSATP